MKFSDLVTVLQEINRTTSRNSMTEILAEFFRQVTADEAREVSYLLLGQLGPLFARVDFGVADKMVVRSLARAFEEDASSVQQAFKQVGDLGEVAEGLKEGRGRDKGRGVRDEGLGIRDIRRDNDVSAREVYELLLELAQASGEGSQEKKIDLLATLVKSAALPVEAKFLVRMVLGKMRLGFSDKTLLDALAVMDDGSKLGRQVLDGAYQVSPDIGLIAELVKRHGIKAVPDKVKVRVGVPVMPSLSQRLKSANEMVEKMGKVIVEPKYDGTRVQIHFNRHDGKATGLPTVLHERSGLLLKTFARSLEENTAMFPELTEAKKQIRADSVIIDCEAVGFDPATGKLRPFQETITRKRKYGIEEIVKSIPVKFYCFDLLYVDGDSLLQKPLYERRRLLERVVGPGDALVVDPLITTESADEIRAFHQTQLNEGYEGAMVKKYDGEYQPGRTGWNWVKFKEVEEANGKLRDTIDGVVMGYYRGRGKRSAFGIGAFLFGIRDEANGDYVTVAKIGTGLSDEQWREMRHRIDSNFSMEKPTQFTVATGLIPDVWAEPRIVVEIAADEITNSPLHTSGYGLRFPRLVRFREDKRVDQTTTLEEIEQLK